MAGHGRHLSRSCAVQALYQWMVTGQRCNVTGDGLVDCGRLAGQYRDFYLHLVRNIPEHVELLDRLLVPHLDRSIEDVDLVELAILRVGSYELKHHLETPSKVIINEAIRLAKTFSSEYGYRFVNGVLDKVACEVRSEAEA